LQLLHLNDNIDFDDLISESREFKRKLPPLLNYQELGPPPPTTRATSDSPCSCKICLIARQNLTYSNFAAKHTNPTGAPPQDPKSPPAKALTVCSRCFTLIGKGVPHPCVKAQKVANLSNIVRNTSGKSRSKVAAATLKTIAEDQGVSARGVPLNFRVEKILSQFNLAPPESNPRKPSFLMKSLRNCKLPTTYQTKPYCKY
jgi:hypothetical protein